MGAPPFQTVICATFIRTLSSGDVLLSVKPDCWLRPHGALHTWIVPPEEGLRNELSFIDVRWKKAYEYIAVPERALTQAEAFGFRRHSVVVLKSDILPASPVLFEPKDVRNVDGEFVGRAVCLTQSGEQYLLQVQVGKNTYIDIPYVSQLIVKEDEKTFIMEIPQGLEPYSE